MAAKSRIEHERSESATIRFRNWMEEMYDSSYPATSHYTVMDFFRFVKRDMWGIPAEEFIVYEDETADGPWFSPEELCSKSKRDINDLLQNHPYCADFDACIQYERAHKERSKVLRRLKQRKNNRQIDFIWVSEEDVQKISYEEPNTFVKHKKQNCSKNTIGSYLDRLRKFDDWCSSKYYGDIREHGIDFTPAEMIHEAMTKSKTLPKSFSVEQVKQLLQRNRGTLARALILTGVKTGARRNELHSLDWGDIHLDDQYLVFEQRKMGHEHVKVLFDSECARALHALYHEQGCPGDDAPVFVHSPGERLAKNTLLGRVKGYAENADVSFDVGEQCVNTHTFRHTFRNHYETKAGGTKRGQEFLCDLQLSHEPERARDTYRMDLTQHTRDERREDYRQAVPKYLI